MLEKNLVWIVVTIFTAGGIYYAMDARLTTLEKSSEKHDQAITNLTTNTLMDIKTQLAKIDGKVSMLIEDK